MMRIVKKLILVGLLFVLLFTVASPGNSQNCSSKENCEKLIEEYTQKLTDLGNQRKTLASQIEFMDTQIYLTTLQIQETENKIEETEEEIEQLGGRITNLNSSLDHLSRILLQKIVAGYKHREVPVFDVFLDSENASVLANRLKYARIVEENDRQLAFQMQKTKFNYETQRDLREEKKIELDQLTQELDQKKVDLDNQKSNKQTLLTQTQNDERTYQNLLAIARAEYAAIQGIIAGGGTETLLRNVSRGEVIGTIISGSSCNSTGSHLHFTVLEGGGHINPFSRLKSIDHVDQSGGDEWNPSGPWDWPLDAAIVFNQGYGSNTSFIRSGAWYPFHNGIDIFNSSYNIKAVEDGTLYRGSYSVGCTLPYTKVVHSNSNYSTLYLHTYTQ